VQRIPVGDHPTEAILTPNSHRLYVSNLNGDTISVIDTATNTVVDTISVNPGPAGDRVYLRRFPGLCSS
jgi:YVTN family beta-propeller protein